MSYEQKNMEWNNGAKVTTMDLLAVVAQRPKGVR